MGKMEKLRNILKICENWIMVWNITLELTCSDGIQYGLQAYGEEAISLYKETMKTLGKNT